MKRALAQAIAAGVLVALAEYSVTRRGIDASWAVHAEWLARLTIHWTLAAIPFAAAFAWLDARASDRPAPWRDYAIATAALVAAVTPLLALAAPGLVGVGEGRLLGEAPAYLDTVRFLAWQLAFWSALGAVLHRLDAGARRTAHALRDAELGSRERERRVARSRLRAACARVVPEFLLAALRDIESTYGRDAAAADRAIASLVAYLRLALAHAREDLITLDAETALVEAWLRAGGDDRPRAVSTPSRASRIRIEPGLVVPSLYRLRIALGKASVTALDVSIDAGHAVFAMRVDAADGAVSAREVDALRHELASHADALDLAAEHDGDRRWTLRVSLPAHA